MNNPVKYLNRGLLKFLHEIYCANLWPIRRVSSLYLLSNPPFIPSTILWSLISQPLFFYLDVKGTV